MRITELFDRGLRLNPRGTAYVMGDRSWTYTQAYELSCKIAQGLIATVAPGTKVGILSPNNPEAWICVLGSWRAGMVWVPLNPASPPEETAALAASFDCEVMFFHSSMVATVELLKRQVPSLPLAVCIDGELDLVPGLHDWCSGYPSNQPEVKWEMDDVVAIPPTGGTTGRPKGAMNTHRSLVTSIAHLLITLNYDPHEPIVNLAAAPMTHTTGILSLPATVRGGTVVVLEKPDTNVLAKTVEQHKVTELFLPPTVIYRWLDRMEGEQHDFSSLRYFIYASAPMSVDRLKRAIEVFGPVMTAGYGQMESPGTIALMRCGELFNADGSLNETRLDACGRPSPLISVEIRDNNDRPVQQGQPGEICVRGDTVMAGYYAQPEETAKTIVNGWLHTGDIGHIDGDGYLHITDRKKDMIISGGFNVYPSEIEQVLWRHPAVGDCAVIGIPDEDWGEAVTAVVELRDGAHATSEELRTWCRQILGGIRTPKRIDIVDELPRSPNGKVVKNLIREPYWASVNRRI